MNNHLQEKQLRREFSVSGWALLIYWGIMNFVVGMVSTLDILYRCFQVEAAQGTMEMLRNMEEIMTQSLTGNGWGYILTCLVGFGILLLWKKGRFLTGAVFARGKPMTVGTFGSLLCFMAAGQVLYQLLYLYQEGLLNTLGSSMADMLEAASPRTDTLSMFFYVGILGPVAEEILFRGLVLRLLRPHGKTLAILGSAFLFGIFHGNLVQAPFAFFVGLVLGYAALEYSVVWAMALHVFNNLVLGALLPRLLSGLAFADVILGILLMGMTLAAVVIAIRKRKEIAGQWQENPLDGSTARCFFTAPGVLTVTAVMWANMLLVLLMSVR